MVKSSWMPLANRQRFLESLGSQRIYFPESAALALLCLEPEELEPWTIHLPLWR